MSGTDPGAYLPTRTGAHAAADLAPGTRLAGRFEIEGILGVGGMGVVYRARDTALDIPVALKLLRPELASRPESFERFRQELLLARQVSSQHVVRIHDIAVDDGRWFISMDLVDGEPLDRRLDRDGALPVDEALAIARQLALGLQAAHARGIVHRDLKPSNVLVDRDGQVRISDFGVARSLGASGLTQTGSIVGTPDYLSPEQARGGVIDGRSDLYALGLMLHEMISGAPAFAAGTPAESLAQRLVNPPPRLDSLRRDVPEWVARLVERLTQPRAARRLPDAAAVIAAIDARALPRADRAGGRTFAVAAVVAGVAIAGALWWSVSRTPETASSTPVPMAVAPAAVPDRLVVVVAPGDDAAGLPAIAEMLRLGWSSAGATVVDAERAELARVQAGFSDARPADDAELLAVVPARRLLRLAIDGEGDARELVAHVAVPPAESRRFAEPVGDDLVDAAGRLAERLRAPLGVPALPDAVRPPTADALAIHADALALRRAGRMEEAADTFAMLTEAAPTFAPAWLGLAETADLAGQQALAQDAARRGAALPGATQTPLAALARRFDGDPAAALAAQRAQVQSRPDDLDAQLVLADMELDAGEFAAAIGDLRALLARDPSDPRAWFLLGKASILHGEPRRAVDEHLVRAVVLFKRGRSLFGEAETTNALGVGYARLGQIEDAEEQYRKALSLRRALGDRRGTASSLRNLAQIAMIRGDFDAARAELDEARTLFAAIGDDAGGAAIDNELGLLAEERGRFADALVAYKRALRGRERGGDAPGIAETLNNIGFAHYQLGDYDNARVFWRQARAAFAGIDDRNGLVRADQNLGLLALARGDWDEAARLLDASLAEAQARHLHEEAAVSRRNRAELALLQGRLGDAAADVRAARALFAEREDVRGVVDADLLRARLFAAAGNTTAATAQLDAMADALARSSAEQQAIAMLLRAQLAEAAGDAANARRLATGAVALADDAGVQALRLQARMLALAPGDDGAALDADIATLGNLPLQLLRLERATARALDAGDTARARDAWREAESLLGDDPRWHRAATLHDLGARVAAAAGDAEGAGRAAADAVAAADRLREATPAELLAEPEPAPRESADVAGVTPDADPA